jgi:hypothetical protein
VFWIGDILVRIWIRGSVPLSYGIGADPAPEPDPALSSVFFTVFRIRIHFLRIRIQWIRMEANTDPDTDPDPIRIQGFNDQKLKKNNS